MESSLKMLDEDTVDDLLEGSVYQSIRSGDVRASISALEALEMTFCEEPLPAKSIAIELDHPADNKPSS